MPKQEDTGENRSCFPSVILNAYQCMTHQRSYDHLRTNRTFNIIQYQVTVTSKKLVHNSARKTINGKHNQVNNKRS